MKTFIILPLFFIFSLSLNANELSWVDEQVEAIKPMREGMKNSKIASIEDPFIFLKKNRIETEEEKKKKKKNHLNQRSRTTVASTSTSSVKTVKTKKRKDTFRLNAIINKSALIGNKWYKLNDKVKNFTLSSIDKTTVTLKNSNKTFTLTTESKNKHLKYKKNRTTK